MITAYHRPHNLEEALKLLYRNSPRTLPLGGGTLLSHGTLEPVEVVDLQAVNLNFVRRHGKDLEVGATCTLQQLIESDGSSASLIRAIHLEAPLNLRNAATVAGTLASCDGRSTLTTALLALDARLTIFDLNPKTTNPIPSMKDLGDFLPFRSPGLITQISIPLQPKLAFDYVSRTPADKPIVCIALAQWPSGRTRLAVGGSGKSPLLAADGTGVEGLETAARNALHDAADEWASAEYRMDVAATLAGRSLAIISIEP